MSDADRFNFQSAMAERLERLTDVDLVARVDALGAHISGNAMLVPFFGIRYRVSAAGVTGADGRAATPAVASLLLDYILRCPVTPPTPGTWITFREFSGAGPLMGFFAANTHKLIQSHFSGNVGALEAACSGLAGSVVQTVSHADLCMELTVLPRLPMRITFNDRDEDFAAQCSLLFKRSAETYLSMKSMAVAGTWLAGRLVSAEAC